MSKFPYTNYRPTSLKFPRCISVLRYIMYNTSPFDYYFKKSVYSTFVERLCVFSSGHRGRCHSAINHIKNEKQAAI